MKLPNAIQTSPTSVQIGCGITFHPVTCNVKILLIVIKLLSTMMEMIIRYYVRALLEILATLLMIAAVIKKRIISVLTGF